MPCLNKDHSCCLLHEARKKKESKSGAKKNGPLRRQQANQLFFILALNKQKPSGYLLLTGCLHGWGCEDWFLRMVISNDMEVYTKYDLFLSIMRKLFVGGRDSRITLWLGIFHEVSIYPKRPPTAMTIASTQPTQAKAVLYPVSAVFCDY